MRMGLMEMCTILIQPAVLLLGNEGGVERDWTRNSSVRMMDAARVIQGPNIYIDTN
jgi:hypothetical protein